MKELSLTALFGFVAFIISWGLLVPTGLRAFNLLAAAGSMAGYVVGKTASQLTGIWVVVFAIGDLILCFASIMAYLILVQRGSANISDIVFLGGMLTLAFFSFAFLLSLAGIVINRNWPRS